MATMEIMAESLADQVYQALQRAILEGRLKPGDRIQEKELTAQLGISRTPIREALIKLEMAGIVTCNSRRSYNVRLVTVTDIHEAFDILGILEGPVVQAVVPLVTERDLKLLQEYNHRMAEEGFRGDFHAYGAWNEKFHNVFISKYWNRSLQDLCDSVRRLLYIFPVRHDSLHQWIEKSVKEHEEIIRLTAAKDGPALEAFFRQVHWNHRGHGRFIADAYAGEVSPVARPGIAVEKIATNEF